VFFAIKSTKPKHNKPKHNKPTQKAGSLSKTYGFFHAQNHQEQQKQNHRPTKQKSQQPRCEISSTVKQ